MFLPFHKAIKSSKGISVISVIILAAMVFAALNVYAYFNPDFSLRKYSLVRYLTSINDNQRKADLRKLQAAIEDYYEREGEYPAYDGWCGRIFTFMHPEVKEAISDYFSGEGIPQDPSFAGTKKDYFYWREDKNKYILMAVLERPPAGSPTYNYEGCHDWPGDDVYNYQIVVSR